MKRHDNTVWFDYLWIAVLAILLCGCGPLQLVKDPDSRWGVTPQVSVEASPDLAEIANPALDQFVESAPENPADLTGWIIAAIGALAVGGTAAAKKYLGGKGKQAVSAAGSK